MRNDILAIELANTKTNHILHLLLSIVTMGFWVIIWILATIDTGMKRSSLIRQMNTGEYEKDTTGTGNIIGNFISIIIIGIVVLLLIGQNL